MATFYSRSRKERWCKGETSGNFIRVTGVSESHWQQQLRLTKPISPVGDGHSNAIWQRKLTEAQQLNCNLQYPGPCLLQQFTATVSMGAV